MPFRTTRLQTNQEKRAAPETRLTQSHATLTEVILRQAQDRLLVIAEQGIVRHSGLAGWTHARLLHPRAALTAVILRQAQDRLLVIAEPMLLRQHGITVNTNDTRRTRYLTVHWTPPVCTAFHPCMSSLTGNTTSPFPDTSLFREVSGKGLAIIERARG